MVRHQISIYHQDATYDYINLSVDAISDRSEGLIIGDKYYYLEVNYVPGLNLRLLDLVSRVDSLVVSVPCLDDQGSKYNLVQVSGGLGFAVATADDLRYIHVNLAASTFTSTVLITPIKDAPDTDNHLPLGAVISGQDIFLQFGQAQFDGHTHVEWITDSGSSVSLHKKVELEYVSNVYGSPPNLVAGIPLTSADFIAVAIYPSPVSVDVIRVNSTDGSRTQVAVVDSGGQDFYAQNGPNDHVPPNSIILSGGKLFFCASVFSQSYAKTSSFVEVGGLTSDSTTFTAYSIDPNSSGTGTFFHQCLTHKNKIYILSDDGVFVFNKSAPAAPLKISASTLSYNGMLPVGNELWVFAPPQQDD